MSRQNAKVNNQHPPHQPLNAGKGAFFHKPPRHSRKSRQRRMFITATLCFIAMLVIYQIFFVPQLEDPKTPIPFSARNLSALESAIAEVQKDPTLLSFNNMMEASMRVSGLLEDALLRVVAASEATPEKPMAYDYELFSRAAKSIRKAADIAYENMKEMLRGTLGEDSRFVPNISAKALFGWVATTAHIYGAVLTEYYLLDSSTLQHAVSLIRTVNVLDWASGNEAIFKWSEAPCVSVYQDASKNWLSFCETSCASLTMLNVRQAASYEELIALYPHYGPFRLHYVILLALGQIPYEIHNSIIKSIRGQKSSLNTYTSVDTFHNSYIALLEACVLPLEQQAVENARRIVGELLGSCEHLLSQHFIETNHSKVKIHWPGTFSDEVRPALLTRTQLRILLRKLEPIMDAQQQAMLDNLKECLY